MAHPWTDLGFALSGGPLPSGYRAALDRALETVCPWLAEVPYLAVHPLKLSAGGGGQALLSGRTRLVLRLPDEHAERASALQGMRLELGDIELFLGSATRKPVAPWGTLYAHLVSHPVASETEDETDFLAHVARELDALGVKGRVICGRRQVLPDEGLTGHGLMVDGLSASASLRLQCLGLGPHRRLGCGVFVPHKSATAVGVPD